MERLGTKIGTKTRQVFSNEAQRGLFRVVFIIGEAMFDNVSVLAPTLDRPLVIDANLIKTCRVEFIEEAGNLTVKNN